MREDNCDYILESLDQGKLKFNIHNQQMNHIKKQAAELSQKDQGSKDLDLLHTFTDDDFTSLPKKIIDLESLVFPQGSHYMSNDKC